MGFHGRCDTMIGMLQRRVIDLENQLAELSTRTDEEKRELLNRIIDLTDPVATRARMQRESERLAAERATMAAAANANTRYPDTPAPGAPRTRLAGSTIPAPVAQPRRRPIIASPANGAVPTFDPSMTTPGPAGPGGVTAPLQVAPAGLGDDDPSQ